MGCARSCSLHALQTHTTSFLFRQHLTQTPRLTFLVPALYSTKSNAALISNSQPAKITATRHGRPRACTPLESLNPPSSTLPPPLNLPNRDVSESRLRFYYQTGKAYLSFYKTGLKALLQNYRLLRSLNSRIPRGVSPERALKDDVLTRGEYLLIHRTKRDLWRIPAFGLVLMICGELTPLVVVFMGLSGAVPGNCQLPKQIVGAREKLEARRRESFRKGTAIESGVDVSNLGNLPRPVLAHIGRSLGLYSSWWDRLGVTPTLLLPHRVRKTLERLDADDLALRDGGVRYLNDEELKIAMGDRGLDVSRKAPKELRDTLQRWLDVRQYSSIINLLTKRPAAWPKKSS